MKHIPKERREAHELRERIKSLLAEPHGWRGYEDQQHWLRKLLQRDEDHTYTAAERDAVERIRFARTPFEKWAGYSVRELTQGALRYVADFDYEDELFLKAIQAEHATQLVRDDMKTLVGLCRIAGMDLPKFNSRHNEYDEA